MKWKFRRLTNDEFRTVIGVLLLWGMGFLVGGLLGQIIK